MLKAVQTAARRAAGAWRRVRAVDGALVGLTVGLVAIAAVALGLELSSGLEGRHLPWLLLALVPAPALALIASLRPIALPVAASEADRRAGLSDRLGTAIEFAADGSAMATLQRADAATHADGLRAGALFAVPWRRRLVALFGMLALALLVVGASLTFRLGPKPPPELAAEPSAADDLLADIAADKERYEELGNKEAVRLLTDLERQILQIQAREEDLRDLVDRRRKERPPEQEEEEFEPEVEITIEEPEEKKRDLITAEDLARLEAETLEQLALTDAQEAELISQLFSTTRSAGRLADEFAQLARAETEVAKDAPSRSEYSSTNTSEKLNNPAGEDPIAEAFADEAFNSVDDPTRDIQDAIRRDLGAEALAEHDKQDLRRESFNQFMKEFVKDVKDIVADAALGKSSDGKRGKKGKGDEKEGRQVQTDTGEGMADKRDAMADSGFEEMEDVKRSDGGVPPEQMSGADSMTPPENMGPGDGKPDENAMARAGGGQTAAGASGAGTGTENKEGEGLQLLIDRVVDPEAPQGPLEQVLSQISAGKMPAEKREALFDRIARHKVKAGPASEADDVIVDYFAEVEELMVSNRDQLPPLFRDYAHTYFEAIRPGAAKLTD
jgi:hypothetical protein